MLFLSIIGTAAAITVGTFIFFEAPPIAIFLWINGVFLLGAGITQVIRPYFWQKSWNKQIMELKTWAALAPLSLEKIIDKKIIELTKNPENKQTLNFYLEIDAALSTAHEHSCRNL